jgi:mRNA interferase RelE/StbE
MFAIKYSKQAIKTKAKMPKSIAEKVDAELEIIATNPATYQGDWKPLQGSPFWRLRVGGWRAICEIANNELIIYVLPLNNRISALTKSFSARKVQKTTSNLLKNRIERRYL